MENPESCLTAVSEPGSGKPRSILEDSGAATVSAEERINEDKYQLIAEAAYYRSQARSFAPGCELEDWLAAEAEIESRLSETSSPVRSKSNGDKRPRRR
jgi:hypothetical protein